jgi:hypothetical protein
MKNNCQATEKTISLCTIVAIVAAGGIGHVFGSSKTSNSFIFAETHSGMVSKRCNCVILLTTLFW